MALVIVEDLQPSEESARLPADLTFTVGIRDTAAGTGTKTHTLTLKLEDANDLSFEDPETHTPVKTLDFVRDVRKKKTSFRLAARVTGEGAGLGAFNVTLEVPGTAGTECLVGLK